MALFDFLKRKKTQDLNTRQKETAKQKTDGVDIEEKKESLDKPKTDIISGERFVLISPHVTERARASAEIGQYTFRIYPSATKRDVKQSVEHMYHVHVERVQIVKVHEKPRRRGLTEGVKKGYKKAVVALRKGEAIDIF